MKAGKTGCEQDEQHREEPRSLYEDKLGMRISLPLGRGPQGGGGETLMFEGNVLEIKTTGRPKARKEVGLGFRSR